MILSRSKTWVMISGFLVFLVASAGSLSWGYEEADFSDGGTVLGQVTLQGEPPQPRIDETI